MSLQTSRSEASGWVVQRPARVSNVIGNCQYCSCSPVCTAPVPQKAPVCSDLSKQLAQLVAQQKQPSPTLAFTFLEGSWKELSFPVVADPIHIQLALVSARIFVLPFEMKQWQKCRLLREFSRPDNLHKRQILCPREGRQFEALFLTALSMTKGQVFRIDTYFSS